MARSKHLVVLSISSDIGYEYSLHRLNEGDYIVGTYRNDSRYLQTIKEAGAILIKIDINDAGSLARGINKIISSVGSWDKLLVCTGSLEPIGLFHETSFEEWQTSHLVNFLGPMRVLHALLPHRGKDARVVFFAGGGVNGAKDGYSAYTSSKIALIKNVELLDHEIKDAIFSIIGPGWIKTKIHSQTFKAVKVPKESLDSTAEKFASDNFGSLKGLVSCIDWVFKQEKGVVGGRNISYQHDSWETNLDSLLREDKDLGKLRRFGNNLLSKYT